jgi:hypothetical protein
MAKIVERPRADGGVSYRVMWVIAGGRLIGAGYGDPGSQASETFTDRTLMLAFKGAVEAQGHQWPVGWTKGRGWVTTDTPSSATDANPTLDAVHAEWLDAERQKVTLRRKNAKSVGRDDSIYRRVIQPTFGTRPFVSIQRSEVRRRRSVNGRPSTRKPTWPAYPPGRSPGGAASGFRRTPCGSPPCNRCTDVRTFVGS